MSDGCTDCGRKGGCDHRKGEMFGAIDQALARLYPTRRWDERDEAAGFGAGVPAEVSVALTEALARRLEALALFRPGAVDESCDYIYVLCFGRQPSILEVREGAAPAAALLAEEAEVEALEELHLRVALSALAGFAAVQQVALRARRSGQALVITEIPRTGVFDPILLGRFRRLVSVLAELDVRHLDFGEITQPPAGFEPGDYRERYGAGADPSIANYLFYPQPASAITTTVIPFGSP